MTSNPTPDAVAVLRKRKCNLPAPTFGVVRTGGGVIITLRLRTTNPLNGSHHNWFVEAKRRKNERKIVGLELLAARPLPPLPVAVRMTRLSPGTRAMDADGLSASMKCVRDSIASAYGIDDADNRIEFMPCRQQRAKEYGVMIEIVVADAEVASEK